MKLCGDRSTLRSSFWFWPSWARSRGLAASLYVVHLERTGWAGDGLQWDVVADALVARELARADRPWVRRYPVARDEDHDPSAIAFAGRHLRKRGRKDLITARSSRCRQLCRWPSSEVSHSIGCVPISGRVRRV